MVIVHWRKRILKFTFSFPRSFKCSELHMQFAVREEIRNRALQYAKHGLFVRVQIGFCNLSRFDPDACREEVQCIECCIQLNEAAELWTYRQAENSTGCSYLKFISSGKVLWNFWKLFSKWFLLLKHPQVIKNILIATHLLLFNTNCYLLKFFKQ